MTLTMTMWTTSVATAGRLSIAIRPTLTEMVWGMFVTTADLFRTENRIGDKSDTQNDTSPFVQELNGDKKDVVSGIMEILLEMYSSK